VLGLIFTATKHELVCINKIDWSHFCLHSVYLIKSVDTKLWHTLGYIPDLENMSSAIHYVSWGGFIGKSRSCQNFQGCLEALINPLIGDQGKTTPIYANIWFGDMVALCRIFPQLLMSWVMV